MTYGFRLGQLLCLFLTKKWTQKRVYGNGRFFLPWGFNKPSQVAPYHTTNLATPTKGKVGLDTNDPSTLESTIFAALNNIRARGNFSADTLEYFLNKDPKLARFYLLPKIYKRLHNVPGRLVFSNCGYYTENNSSFLDYQLQRLDKKVKSYIKDTIIFSKSLKN